METAGLLIALIIVSTTPGGDSAALEPAIRFVDPVPLGTDAAEVSGKEEVEETSRVIPPEGETTTVPPVVVDTEEGDETPTASIAPRLLLSVETPDLVTAGTPFTIRIRAFDLSGLPADDPGGRPIFSSPMGVSPVISGAGWTGGELEDSITISSPGESVRLTVTVGEATATRFIEVRYPGPDIGEILAIAETKASEGDLAGAAEAYRVALGLAPDRYDIPMELGRLMLRMERYDEAEDYFRRATANLVRSE